MPGPRPKLGKLSTPVTSSFPSEITSASTATPLSGLSYPFKPDPDFVKTPISPPSAYTDFLSRAVVLNSPSVTSGDSSPDSVKSNPEAEREGKRPKLDRPLSTSTAASTVSTKSTDSGRPSAVEGPSALPPSPLAPMSAPPCAASFPSFKLPPSPAVSNIESPLSASTIRSPFSARPVHSVFDWDAAIKARFPDIKKQKPSRTSVKHIREVVTRTVTYTPRMDPAPRGKRRKVE